MNTYPRVKVRVVEEQEKELSPRSPNDDKFLLFSKVAASPPSVKGKENHFDSPPSFAKVTKLGVSKSATASTPTSKGKCTRSTGEANKCNNIRACLIARPRAVLSSPDNDGMIGKRNKLNDERPSALRKCSSETKVPAQSKVSKSQEKTDSTLKTRTCYNSRRGASNQTYGAATKKGISETSCSKTKNIP